MDEIMFVDGLVPEKDLAHIGRSKMDGAKVGSGRYPLGSGENPYHHGTLLGKFVEKRAAKKKAKATAERMENMRAAKAAKAEKAKAEATAKEEAAKAAEEHEAKKQAAIQSGRPEDIAPFITEMSTKELQDVKNRLQAMLDLNDVMMKKDPSYGRSRAEKAMVMLQRANKNTNTVVDSYNNVARILNAIRGTKLPIIPNVANAQQNKGNNKNNKNNKGNK